MFAIFLVWRFYILYRSGCMFPSLYRLRFNIFLLLNNYNTLNISSSIIIFSLIIYGIILLFYYFISYGTIFDISLWTQLNFKMNIFQFLVVILISSFPILSIANVVEPATKHVFKTVVTDDADK